jgi:hypothetical protein
MANAAARLPAGAEAIMLDIGRTVALWASAFEILAPSNREAFREMYALLDKNNWQTQACKDLKYEAYGYKTDQTLRSLPSWIFGEINHARNDYLHGNPIGEHRLIVAPAKRPIHFYAPILYRMALAAFLNLEAAIPPQCEGESDEDYYFRRRNGFGKYQGDIEVALFSIMYTPDEWRSGKHRYG